MPAHPTLKESDAQQIVKWMLSLANNNSTAKSLPASGKVLPTGDPKKKDNTVFTLTATLHRRGWGGHPAAHRRQRRILAQPAG
jgi:hypothetical protein